MATSLDLVGGSSYFWHWKHAVFHHSFVNRHWLRHRHRPRWPGSMTPHHPRAWIHRWQHLYVWFLYGAMVVKWHLYDDFRLALTSRMGQHRFPRPRGWQWVVFFGGKLVFLALAFAVPLALHPAWAVAAVYVTTTVIVGVVLAIVFQLAHCVGQPTSPWTASPVVSTRAGPSIKLRAVSTLRAPAEPRAGCSVG
jgi:linoleoyl-CoA desaturase